MAFNNHPRYGQLPLPKLPGFNLTAYDPETPRFKGQRLSMVNGIPTVTDDAPAQNALRLARPATAQPRVRAPPAQEPEGRPTGAWNELGGAPTSWAREPHPLAAAAEAGAPRAPPDLSSLNLTGKSFAAPAPAPAPASMTRPQSARAAVERPSTALEGAVGVSGVAPAWIAYDRKVLRFYAYFEEMGMEGKVTQVQVMRVRKCTFYFYLEDGTLHIGEKKEDNSGFVQGILVKRHRVPHQDGTFVSLAHLNVGEQVEIYRRVYTLVGCDDFTRAFLEREGVAVPAELAYPPDGPREDSSQRIVNRQRFTEAEVLKLEDKSRQFIEYDRKVLRFFATWDNRDEPFGDRRAYVLHYFLADDTVEVLEVVERNSGRDPFPKLLSRGKLPKQVYSIGARPMSEDSRRRAKHEYYGWKELRIGSFVEVYGRSLQLHDCDEFTRAYYMAELGLGPDEFAPVPLEPPNVAVPKPALPPHTGFGSEEDSAESCLRLMPKKRQKDWHKWNEAQGKVMRFTACFGEDEQHKVKSSVDAQRQFVVTYYLEDDTVAIFEPPQRNSGVVGGKFLERAAVKKPGRSIYYRQRDFYVGAAISIHAHLFVMTSADEATLTYMEKGCREHGFLKSDFQSVLSSLAAALRANPTAADALRTRALNLDPAGTGKIPATDLQTALVELAAAHPQEALTFARRLQETETNLVSVVDALAALGAR
mmetsp:Transcript_256/g.787  ORF Transcript_256/g.787 Transcript_256/m.787 type:complete len:703 (+) Transcript_256:243-2351(+)